MADVSKRDRGRMSTVLGNRSLVGEATPELKDEFPHNAFTVDFNCSEMSDENIAWFSFSSRLTTFEENPAVSGISDRIE